MFERQRFLRRRQEQRNLVDVATTLVFFWLLSSVLSPGSFRVDGAELIFGQMLFFQIQKDFKSKKFSNLKRFQIQKVFKSKKFSNPKRFQIQDNFIFTFIITFNFLCIFITSFSRQIKKTFKAVISDKKYNRAGKNRSRRLEILKYFCLYGKYVP